MSQRRTDSAHLRRFQPKALPSDPQQSLVPSHETESWLRPPRGHRERNLDRRSDRDQTWSRTRENLHHLAESRKQRPGSILRRARPARIAHCSPMHEAPETIQEPRPIRPLLETSRNHAGLPQVVRVVETAATSSTVGPLNTPRDQTTRSNGPRRVLDQPNRIQASPQTTNSRCSMLVSTRPSLQQRDRST